jgi:hypothetical protein
MQNTIRNKTNNMDEVQYINNTKSHLNGVRYIIDNNGDHRLFVSDLVDTFGRGFLDRPRMKNRVSKRRIAGQTRRLVLKRVFDPVLAELGYADNTAKGNKCKPACKGKKNAECKSKNKGAHARSMTLRTSYNLD